MKPQQKAAEIGQKHTSPMGRAKKHTAWAPTPGTDWNPLREWPQNAPCWCGSGTKAKKCCLPTAHMCLPLDRCISFAQHMRMGDKGLELIRMAFRDAKKPVETVQEAQP